MQHRFNKNRQSRFSQYLSLMRQWIFIDKEIFVNIICLAQVKQSTMCYKRNCLLWWRGWKMEIGARIMMLARYWLMDCNNKWHWKGNSQTTRRSLVELVLDPVLFNIVIMDFNTKSSSRPMKFANELGSIIGAEDDYGIRKNRLPSRKRVIQIGWNWIGQNAKVIHLWTKVLIR